MMGQHSISFQGQFTLVVAAMFVDEKPNPRSADLYEDVSREDIVSAFRSAMIGHFRSHVPGTNINESTLLASDYLNHFHELVMLFEAISSEPKGFTDDLMSWRPLTYEEHFAKSGFRDKNLRSPPIAGRRRRSGLASTRRWRGFMAKPSRWSPRWLHDLTGNRKTLNKTCEKAGPASGRPDRRGQRDRQWRNPARPEGSGTAR